MTSFFKFIALWFIVFLLAFFFCTLMGAPLTWEYDGRWHHFQMHQGETAPK